MNRQNALDHFFQPKSIAIIGLSRRALHSPVNILTNLKEFGYEGEIFIVNPNLSSLKDVKVFPNLDSIKHSVDLAIVTVPRSSVLGVLKDCLKNKIQSAIVITQGFADADEEGKRLQNEIVALMQGNDLRILGPNTMGVVNAFSGFTSSFFEVFREKISIGVISQSGLFMLGYQEVKNFPAGFGMAVDLGNACDISVAEMLEYYEKEEKIKIIQIHMETLEGGEEFLKIAHRVSRQKPIIALKSGQSLAGQKAAASHSGAVAGDNEVIQAVFKKSGIINADDCEELRLFSRAFLTYQPLRGNRVAVMTFSGAAGILALDALEETGLSLAFFSEATLKALKEFFPLWMEVKNPLDIWMAVSSNPFQETYARILECLLQDENVDAIVCIYISFSLPKHNEFNAAIPIRKLASQYPQKPILCWTYGSNITGFTEEIERDGTVIVFPSLRYAAKTLKKLHGYEVFKRPDREKQRIIHFRNDGEKIKTILLNAQKEGKQYLFEESLEILKCCDINVARWAVVKERQEIEQIRGKVSFPVVLKVISPGILHKSDLGAIRMDIGGPDELGCAFEEMINQMKNKMPQASITGMLIQERVPAGKEIMIGAKKDPTFGYCLIVGSGGIYTEAMKDYAFGIAPLTEEEALGMISQLKYYKILKGFRGEPPTDVQFIVETLLKVSQLVINYPEVGELDLNPLIVYENSGVVVDARMLLK